MNGGGALRRIVVTGPESTGKTTLSRRLAELAHAEWLPEASRIYAERKGGELLASDVAPIAREHIRLADAAAERARAGGNALLVLDTDLLSTVIYARHYYRLVPDWVERIERARRGDLYLLCDIDVPWIPDGIRDRPANREEMFALFRDALVRRKAPFVLVQGDWDKRWEIARAAVAPFLAAR
ncbi:MAG TPA: ATP-binding protein [Gemmatimonadaceae bacterium]|nr:ATP-binding protein [Gemmatimonadaceae bacterium]